MNRGGSDLQNRAGGMTGRWGSTAIGADRKAAMEQQGFIGRVKAKGSYKSGQAASTAVQSVFGAVKCLLSPAASEAMRRALPRDAAQLWASAPLEFRTSREVLNKGRVGAPAGAISHLF